MAGEREEIDFPLSTVHLTCEEGYAAAARAAAKALDLPQRTFSPGTGPVLHFGALITDLPAASELGQQGYLLCVEQSEGDPVVRCLGRTPRTAFYALRQLQAAWRGETSIPLPLGITAGGPAFIHRGIAEAVPVGWSWDTRRRLLLFAGRHQFDHYVYAPDDDPFRTACWREPYPPEEAQRLTDFISQGRELFVDILYALQPELDPTSGSDMAALATKCCSILKAGAAGIVLFCAAGTGSARLWAQLASRLLVRLRVTHPCAGLWLRLPPLTSETGPVYQVSQALNAEVELLWTGPELLNRRLSRESVATFSNYVGRVVWLWDNYPDNRLAPQRLFLGPYQGRDPALAQHLRGVTAVPMQQAVASQIALTTVADFLWDPTDYDPDASWERAIREVGGTTADALRQFAGLSRSSILDHREDEELDTGLAAWELEGFHGYLARKLLALEDALGSLGPLGDNRPLMQEIAPWLEKAGYLVRTASHALELSHSLRTSRKDAEGLYRQAALELGHSRRLPQIVAPFRLDRFAVRALRQAEVKLGKPLGRIRTTAPRGREHPWGMAADGDLMTSFRATADLQPGDSITLDMGTVMEVQWVHLSQGYFYYWPTGCVEEGRLLSSIDGETWEALTRIEGPGAWEVDLHLDPPHAIRYVRLVNDAPRPWPMVVRQLEVYE